jgi:hypothetical protein
METDKPLTFGERFDKVREETGEEQAAYDGVMSRYRGPTQ